MTHPFRGLFAKLGKGVELIKLNEAFGLSLGFNQVHILCLPLLPGAERADKRVGGVVIYQSLRLKA